MIASLQLHVLAWNIYIGHASDEVRKELRSLIELYSPGVIVLMEASHMFKHLDGLGYKVVQLRSRPLRRGNTPGQGNIAILVRNDIPIKKRLTLSMVTFWVGPKIRRRQDPRVYRAVKIQLRDKVWKVGGAHTPFGQAARDESRTKLVRWLKNSKFGRPTVLVLDANMSMSEFKRDIAEPGGALVSGERIDLIAYKNAELTSEKNLGRHGSDHPVMLYKLRAR